MILVDVAEPADIVDLLKQAAPVTIMPLNDTSRADYFFGGEDGRSRQFCRVQAGELLGSISSQEDELRRYYENADQNALIVEGFITDVPMSKSDRQAASASVRFKQRPNQLFAHRVASNGYMLPGHSFNTSAEHLYAWLFRIQECDVQLYFTHNWVGTAKLLAAIFANVQRPPDEHSTLNRYYIPNISIKEKDDGGKRITIRKQNPMIRGLMALSLIYGMDIGEKKATALFKAGYKTLLDLAYAEVHELTKVEGIGKGTAQKILQAIGRMEEG